MHWVNNIIKSRIYPWQKSCPWDIHVDTNITTGRLYCTQKHTWTARVFLFSFCSFFYVHYVKFNLWNFEYNNFYNTASYWVIAYMQRHLQQMWRRWNIRWLLTGFEGNCWVHLRGKQIVPIMTKLPVNNCFVLPLQLLTRVHFQIQTDRQQTKWPLSVKTIQN